MTFAHDDSQRSERIFEKWKAEFRVGDEDSDVVEHNDRVCCSCGQNGKNQNIGPELPRLFEAIGGKSG
jgi:hypothetical protein